MSRGVDLLSDGSLVSMSGRSGIDFGRYAPTDSVKKVETQKGRDERDRLHGSPSAVAEPLQDWVQETDVDGFNLADAVTPESFENAVDLLVPERQRRGAYPRAYRPGTLREKRFWRGARLPESPPAHAFRDIEAVKARADGRLTAAE